MLVLTRRLHESIRIGSDIEVHVLSIEGDQVKLGITAPRAVAVHRTEVFDAVEAANRTAAELRALDPAALRELIQQHSAPQSPPAEPTSPPEESPGD